MAFELHISAIVEAAKTPVANPWLMANPANVANLANESAPNQPESPKSLAKLAKLAGLAGLAISHERLTTCAGPANASNLAPPPPPLPWLHMDQPWRAADRLYEQHHWQCATCRAAARGHADRCPEGQSLRSRCATQVQAALLQRAP